ncbi:MAG: penicillin acylase family protein [Gemmatimonadaceae bacterium]|nr:penicillin acylase family protein [Gemmatimonadaceae bacterium]
MKKYLLILAAAALACSRGSDSGSSPSVSGADMARMEAHAQAVTITRDDWGIPHVKGKSDADAVFGVIYAQAEDDFNRVETNYLVSLGRLAEAEGETALYRDLRQRLFIDADTLRAQYARAEPWLKSLMDAWADGLNYYLAKHPEVKPRVITHWEPWMALSFSEGSIGGDIEDISLRELQAFYGKGDTTRKSAALPAHDMQLAALEDRVEREPSGSNGFAIAPSNSASKKALLWINPHTSFFFREEAQMTSDEGLNAYGAITWGQFFIYQGFNEKAGWMHTSSGADVTDEWAETILKNGDTITYEYGNEQRPVTTATITLTYKDAAGPATKDFTVYRTHHGPIVREKDGKWIAFNMMNEPLTALTQSYARTKTKNLAEFRKVMDLHTNSSNNTLFADADGNIAYFHANHVQKRDPRLNWEKPVDGSNPAAEWKGVHSVDESPNVFNPPSGWVQNTNNWPFSAAGPNSPKQKDYPRYMETYPENPRGVHAVMVLKDKKDFTLETLRDAAFDSYLPAFADLIPGLVRAYDAAPAGSPLKQKLAEPMAQLRAWDYRWGATSVPTSLAVYWGEEVWRMSRADAESEDMSVYDYIARKLTGAQKLAGLGAAVDSLTADFGTWKTAWGDINRFQRRTGDIVQPFADSAASIPVPFTSSRWGSLASFGARPYPGTKKWYGTNGNSFVAAAEFGDSVRAIAITAGGVNGNPKNKHFNDQAERYAAGNLRPVYFYPSQLQGHTEKTYKPGQ